MKYTIVNYSVLEDKSRRIDSEYYQQKYLNLDDKLSKYSCKKIHTFAKVTDGEHGSVEIRGNGIKYLTAENIKEGYVDLSNVRYIDKSIDERNKRARVKPGDILVSIKGTLGEVSLAKEWLIPANMNRDVAIIKPSSNEYNSEYLAIFLMSEIGQLQAMRETSGGVQKMITLGRLKKIKIPIMNKKYQELLKKIYSTFFKLRFSSEELFHQAQSILLSEINLKNVSKNAKSIYIKKFSEVEKSNRLDAEYFHPEFDKIDKKLKDYSNGWDVIGNMVEINNLLFHPKKNKKYKYIELSNIGNHGEITGCSEEKGGHLPSRARRKIISDNVIISSVEGSLTKIGLVQKSFEGSLCSTGFIVVKSTILNPESLLVFLKSYPGQQQLKKGCNGTILSAINETEFKKIIIPILDKNVQKKIKNKITRSLDNKIKANLLLDIAKKSIKIAIENDENKASEWIKKKLERINLDYIK